MPIERNSWFTGRGPSCPDEARRAVESRHPKRLDFLKAGLRSGEEPIRHASARALAQCGEPGLLILLRTTAHGRRRERLAAVVCLGECQDVRAVAPLLEALSHDTTERTLRRSGRVLMALFVSALASFFTPRNRTLLDGADEWIDGVWQNALEPEVELRVTAATALGQIGNVRALLPLIRLVHHHEAAVKNAASYAAERLIGTACALPEQAVHSLGSDVTMELISLLAEADEPLKRQVIDLLARIGDPRALPAAERVAQDLSRPHLAQAAKELCDHLRERARQDNARTTLLRAAVPLRPHQQTELVRPCLADGAPHSAQEPILLRSASIPSNKQEPHCPEDRVHTEITATNMTGTADED